MTSFSIIEPSLKKLFRDTHVIHAITIRLEQSANALKEISLNAAIASGHAGLHVRSFGEIAKQIGVLSNRTREEIIEIREITSLMTNYMLECVVNASQASLLMKARDLAQDEKNRALLLRVLSVSARQDLELLDRTDAGLLKLVPSQARLAQSADRLWSLVVGIRVIAGSSACEQESFFIRIADDIERMHAEVASAISTLKTTRDSIERGLDALERTIERDVHAA